MRLKGKHQIEAEKTAVKALRSRYESLIFEYALNPNLLKAFDARLLHYRESKISHARFVEDELKYLNVIEKQLTAKKRTEDLKQEARKRVLNNESTADRVLTEYRDRIKHYEKFPIHPEADEETSYLFGAMKQLDEKHWENIETFLRRAFPQVAHLNRLNVEQRFWHFVATRKDRLPEALERYHRVLCMPGTRNKEKIQEVHSCMREVAFFLHDLYKICLDASELTLPSPEVSESINYVNKLITNFRITELKRG